MRSAYTRPVESRGCRVEEIEIPEPGPGEVLIRVHAAALTRDELDWPTDRLPAIPSYELSGVVAGLGAGVDDLAEGARSTRSPASTETARPPSTRRFPQPCCRAGSPRRSSHVESAALPLAGLSAWQALFDHGKLEAGRARADPRCVGRGRAPRDAARPLAWRARHRDRDRRRRCGNACARRPRDDRPGDAELRGARARRPRLRHRRRRDAPALTRGAPRRRPPRLGRRGAAARPGSRDHDELLRRRAEPRAARATRSARGRGRHQAGGRFDLLPRERPGGLRAPGRSGQAGQGRPRRLDM